jgi:hypothetical protein
MEELPSSVGVGRKDVLIVKPERRREGGEGVWGGGGYCVLVVYLEVGASSIGADGGELWG